MKITATGLKNGITLILISGRMDILGVNEIETKFTAHCAGENQKVVVDMTGVEFLASIGIRLLVTNAKSMSARGGKMVLLNPNPAVMSVLEITDIPSIIPVYSQIESAEAVLAGP
jgi:anti-anti-sigma factor